MSRIKKYFKNNYVANDLWIWVIILSSLLTRIYNCPVKNPSWDTSSYILMGKYLYSFGQIGLWESFRPILYPAILGFFWKLGGDPILLVNILDMCFGLGSIYIIYLIGKAVFSNRVA